MSTTPTIHWEYDHVVTRVTVPFRTVGPLVFALDALVTTSAIFLADCICTNAHIVSDYDFGAGLISAIEIAFFGTFWGVYNIHSLLVHACVVGTIIFASCFAGAAEFFFLFLIHERHSRGAIILFAIYAVILLPVASLLVAKLIKLAIHAGWVRGRPGVLFADPGERERWLPPDVAGFGLTQGGLVNLGIRIAHRQICASNCSKTVRLG